MMRPMGFTLIGLLVVIDSVALLLLCIISSLLKTIKEAVTLTLCGDNERRVISICRESANENHEEVPRSTFRYNHRRAGQDVANKYNRERLPLGNSTVPVNLIQAALNERLVRTGRGAHSPYLEISDVYPCPQNLRVRNAYCGWWSYSLLKWYCLSISTAAIRIIAGWLGGRQRYRNGKKFNRNRLDE